MDIDPTIAMAAFFTQIGARQLKFDFTKAQQYVITHPITQSLILFAMFYLSTRRLIVASALLIIYILSVRIFLNENHPWNLFPQHWLAKEGFIQTEDESLKIPPSDLYYRNLARIP